MREPDERRDDDDHSESEFDDHMRRIGVIVYDWHNDLIHFRAKRARIAAENRRYYGKTVKSRASDTPITRAPRVSDAVAETLAASYGINIGVMTRALNAVRSAYRASNYTDEPGVARDLQVRGREEYFRILREQGGLADDEITGPDRPALEQRAEWQAKASRQMRVVDITEPRRYQEDDEDQEDDR